MKRGSKDLQSEAGQGLAEVGLFLVLVVIVAVVVLASLGVQFTTMFQQVTTAFGG